MPYRHFPGRLKITPLLPSRELFYDAYGILCGLRAKELLKWLYRSPTTGVCVCVCSGAGVRGTVTGEGDSADSDDDGVWLEFGRLEQMLMLDAQCRHQSADRSAPAVSRRRQRHNQIRRASLVVYVHDRPSHADTGIGNDSVGAEFNAPLDTV